MLLRRRGRPREPDYGIDDPFLALGLGTFGVLAVGAAFLTGLLYVGFYDRILELGLGVGGGFIGMFAGIIIWNSAVAKPREAESVAHSQSWGGNETVLNVGCDRGAFLIRSAKRTRGALGLGLDLWKPTDVLGNNPHKTLSNARQEDLPGLSFGTSDPRFLPVRDSTFDVVLVGFSLGKRRLAYRLRALDEVVRVLKPGGTLVMLTTTEKNQAMAYLNTKGMKEFRIKRLLSYLILPHFSIRARKSTLKA